MKRQDHDKILQEAYYGTGGIPNQNQGQFL